jgi:hypothetical protein
MEDEHFQEWLTMLDAHGGARKPKSRTTPPNVHGDDVGNPCVRRAINTYTAFLITV